MVTIYKQKEYFVSITNLKILVRQIKILKNVFLMHHCMVWKYYKNVKFLIITVEALLTLISQEVNQDTFDYINSVTLRADKWNYFCSNQ